ncbi:MAG: TonB-dependent vitamin B12 receptor [Pseudomonadota bacterium]
MKNTVFRARFALAALPCFLSAALASEPATDLGEIVITGARVAQPEDEALAALTVITREDIDRSQATSLAELMQGLPGVSLANSGGPGKSTSLFLRGSNSNHVLVLIDGVRMGSATTGGFAWEHLLPGQIERIEILRGPASSLYGSEAIGGVVQIFTRKGDTRGVHPRLSLGGGSYRTREASAGISLGDGRNWLSAQLSGTRTDGFNAYEGGSRFSPYEGDDDGYRNRAGTLRAGARLGERVEIGAHWLRNDAHNYYDGGFVNESTMREEALGATLRANPVDALRLDLALGQSRDESDNFKDGAFRTRFDTRRDSASLQASWLMTPAHSLTAGLDHLNDHVDSTTAYAVDSRRNTGVFGEWLGRFGALDTQLSLRHDDNQQFGGHSTWTAAAGYALGNGLRLSARAGTAFNAPTFNQLYFPGYGYADLKPEESTSVEIGLDGRVAGLRWQTRVFRNDVDNLINSLQVAPGIYEARNVDQARLQGLEASLHGHLAGIDLGASWTWLDARAIGGANDGKRLQRRPEHSLRLDADRRFGDFSLGGTLYGASQRYDDAANTVRLGGYATLDLRGEYRFARDWRVQLKLVNLFDKAYETAYLYNQTGRAAYLTLHYGH